MTNETEVTQADRERAWPHAPACYRVDDHHNWMAGRYDSLPLVQAFARHRIEAEKRTAPRSVVEALNEAAGWLDKAQAVMGHQTEKVEDRVRSAQLVISRTLASLTTDDALVEETKQLAELGRRLITRHTRCERR